MYVLDELVDVSDIDKIRINGSGKNRPRNKPEKRNGPSWILSLARRLKMSWMRTLESESGWMTLTVSRKRMGRRNWARRSQRKA